jgi:hypothetical protein
VPALEAPQVGAADEPLSWLEALTSAPIGAELDPGTDLDAAHLEAADLHQSQLDQAADPHAPDEGFSDFGIGDLDHDPTAGVDTAPGTRHTTEIHEAVAPDAELKVLTIVDRRWRTIADEAPTSPRPLLTTRWVEPRSGPDPPARLARADRHPGGDDHLVRRQRVLRPSLPPGERVGGGQGELRPTGIRGEA